MQPVDVAVYLALLGIIANIVLAFIGKRPSGDKRLEQQSNREKDLLSENIDLRNRIDDAEDELDKFKALYYPVLEELAKARAANDILKSREASWAADREAWAGEKKFLGNRLDDCNRRIFQLETALEHKIQNQNTREIVP